jgi:beta-N-acetylhexosaminidase
MGKYNKCFFVLVLCIISFLTACAPSPIPKDNESPEASDTSPGTSVTAGENEPEETASAEPVSPSQAEAPPEKTTEERASEILQTMTLEEKAGQMFLVHYPQANADIYAETYQLGGYLLFAKDFYGKTPDDVRIELQNVQGRSKIPMLIGVDEEGGAVNRVSIWPQFRLVPFWSPQSLFREGGMDLIASDTADKARLLLSLGINLNLAPVCDVSTNPGDYIYKRTFGGDAAATAGYVKTVVSVMNEWKIGSVLKHFPGYGINLDTHTGVSVDDRSYESFRNSDFVPFDAGIEAGAGAVLVAHSIVTCMDASLPASLSPEVHRILREELGFDGVIMTDDINMKAITEYGVSEEISVLAVQAGNDLVCCPDFERQLQAVIKAVENGTVSEDRLNESVMRILVWKLNMGIIE